MIATPLLNGRFDAVTTDDAVEWVSDCVRTGRRGWVCTVNVAILMAMRRDPRLQAFVDRAALVVADGTPIVWLSRRLGPPLPERVAGIDLIDRLAARARAERLPLYLLGARAPIVAAAARALRARHPGLPLAGVADGYFAAAEAPARADAVRASGARILLVGMGVPRQEFFIEEQWERLGVNVAIGVGGSFEVLAGARRRAPRWCQRAGLEWAWRLAQEPRRLALRYLVTNWQFIQCAAGPALRAALAGGRQPAGPAAAPAPLATPVGRTRA